MALEELGAAAPAQDQSKLLRPPFKWWRWVCVNLIISLLFSTSSVFAGTIVKYLPGYEGELPFKLETGYLSVDSSELFYYFIESQGNPQEDPIFLWLAGGPGCSSFNGLIYEIGPMEFDIHNYLGGLPKLLPYEYAWTKTASIIFLDSPVGAGFSYSTTAEGWYSSDSSSTKQAYKFLRKWLVEHPQYLTVQLYIGGDSYSGMIVPLVTQYILQGNMAGLKPHLNLRGYLVGSPATDLEIDANSKVIFAHKMALISDEYYECTEGLYANDILEPKCTEYILSPPRIPDYWCRTFNNVLSYVWANDISVQKALNVRPGTVLDWARCNETLAYTKDILSVVEVHKNLSKFTLEVLVETGDRDMVVPFVGTVEWIKSLNLTLAKDWHPWFVDGQVAGYVTRYSQNGYGLTYTTIKGAGHTAPAYYRRECYETFVRWIHFYPV